MALKLRDLSEDEQIALKKLARSRTASTRLVERARIILLASRGQRVPAIADELKLTQATVRTWLTRFNADVLMVSVIESAADDPRHTRPRK